MYLNSYNNVAMSMLETRQCLKPAQTGDHIVQIGDRSAIRDCSVQTGDHTGQSRGHPVQTGDRTVHPKHCTAQTGNRTVQTREQ